jgi:hypothetical protein
LAHPHAIDVPAISPFTQNIRCSEINRYNLKAIIIYLPESAGQPWGLEQLQLAAANRCYGLRVAIPFLHVFNLRRPAAGGEIGEDSVCFGMISCFTSLGGDTGASNAAITSAWEFLDCDFRVIDPEKVWEKRKSKGQDLNEGMQHSTFVIT